MSSSRVILWLSLLLLTIVGGTVEPAYAQIFAGSQQRGGAAPAGQPHWFALLGHVQELRTFELPTATPSLVDVVWLAGKGPASTASGQVRIVRSGRMLQEFLSQTSRTVLQPGDIVIVDGKPAQGRIFRGRSTEASGGIVRLALTGIRPWPIITEVPGERATLRWLSQQLGQNENTAQKARALIPRFTEPVSPDTLLTDCSVVLFDPASIVPGLLPVLPDPVRLGADPKALVQTAPPPAATSAPQPPVTDNSPDQTPVTSRPITPGPAYTRQLPYGIAPGYTRPPLTPGPITSGETPAEAARRTAEPGRLAALDSAAQPLKPAESTASAPLAAQSLDNNPDAVPSMPQPSARVAPPDDANALVEELPAPSTESAHPGADPSAPSAIARPDRSAPSLAEQGAASQPRLAPVPETSPLPEKSPLSVQQPHEDSPTDASQLMAGRAEIVPQEKTPWDLSTVAVSIIGGLGVLAAIAMLLTTGQTPAAAAASTERHPATGDRYWLDRIIENDLPVIEEPVQLPQAEQFFGRATPAARPVHRVDAAAPQHARPHFPMNAAAASGRAPENSRPMTDAESQPAPANSPTESTPTPATPARPSARVAAAFADHTQQPSHHTQSIVGTGSPLRAASLRRIDARHSGQPEAPKSDVVIQPARSVTDGTDLLDRILSRVEKDRS